MSGRINYIIRILFFTFTFVNVSRSYAGTPTEIEEISVTLMVKRLGSTEIPAMIDGKTIYLPVQAVFDFIKIKNTRSATNDSLSGYFIDGRSTYLIDASRQLIRYKDKTFTLGKNDLIKTDEYLFLKSGWFQEIFELECSFEFRSLSINLGSKADLPAIREIQQQMMRKNIVRLTGEKIADTIIGRSAGKFHAGAADWSILTTRETNGETNTRLNLALGAMLAGGEANAFLNYTSGQLFTRSRQYYYWRHVNNDNAAIRQFTVGKIYTPSTSTLIGPVTGIQISNTPTTYRRAFGNYTIYNKTEPGWTVELYVNSVLVNYTKADPSGMYSFEVPMVYGNSMVKQKFYGPTGEERTQEQFISIPFNFIPKNETEYTVTAGVVEDEYRSRFSRAEVKYGLSNYMTIGTGTEYLSSVPSNRLMPFVNTSIRMGSRVLVSAEHAHGVRTRGLVTFRLPSNIQLDVDIARYNKEQRAIRYNYLAEKKAVLSVPIYGKGMNAFTRLTFSELSLPKFKFKTAEWMLSTVIAGVSSNLTLYTIFTDPAYPSFYSNVSLTARVFKGFRITPLIQFEHKEKRISQTKFEVEKSVWRNGFLNMSYEKYIGSNSTYFNVGMRYNFDFTQAAFNIRKGTRTTTTSIAARGSVYYNDKNKRFSANNQSNVGKGGLIISSFLDINCNNTRDAGEPDCRGLSFRISGAQIGRYNADSNYQVSGLEAYANYLMEIDKDGLESVAWQLPKATYSITIEPNRLKQIDVAVHVVGEVSGTVFQENETDKKGLNRMIVNIYSENNVLVTKIITEKDGYFNFMGLKPGRYYASMDEQQLITLKLKSTPLRIPFEIKSMLEGDIVNDINFTLSSK